MLVHCSLFINNFILCSKIVCVSITKQTFAERYFEPIEGEFFILNVYMPMYLKVWSTLRKYDWFSGKRNYRFVCIPFFFLERLSPIKLMLSRYLWILWIIFKHSTYVNNIYLSIIDHMLTFHPDFVGGYDCIWQS